MALHVSSGAPAQTDSLVPPGTASRTCLNCGASLGGAFCSTCGQRVVDLSEPTLPVVREALAEVTELDGRLLRTVRGIMIPGRLTLEFLRGRRAPYFGPLKVFLASGAALTTTWALTRGVDAHFYGYPPPGGSAATYIESVVRGSLAASVVIALCSWLLGGARRRLLDETVFALHLVAALSLLTAVAVWLGTAWKAAWGTAAAIPSGVPSLPTLVFLPAAVVGLGYIVHAVRRVSGGPWWAIALRALVMSVAGAIVVSGLIVAGNRM
ncbi:MAG TPA: DUF3667 domain-containing protein [Gemmatimonadaceae bacterium]